MKGAGRLRRGLFLVCAACAAYHFIGAVAMSLVGQDAARPVGLLVVSAFWAGFLYGESR